MIFCAILLQIKATCVFIPYDNTNTWSDIHHVAFINLLAVLVKEASELTEGYCFNKMYSCIGTIL